MDLNSPKSEPNTEKAEKDEIASKPDDTPKKSKTDYKDKKIEGSSQKPKGKPKNKIEPRKIDIQKEPKHKIQHQNLNHLTPSRNKIERPKFDPTAPTRNKIEPRKIDPKKEPKNKIEPRKIDPKKEPKHKIQRQKLNPLTPSRNKIESPTFNPGREPINKIEPRQFKPGKPRNKIEPVHLDFTREPKNKISLPKLESKDMQNFDTNTLDIDNAPSIQKIKNDTLKPNPIVLYFNNNKKFTKNEIEFLQKNDINIEDLKSRYSWVENEKIAAQFYREVIHSQFIRIPTTLELHKSGFSGYMNAVRKKLRIGYTELVKKAGFTPQYEVRFKYDDKNFSDLQEFFTGKVYPELRTRHGLEGFQPPTSTHISSSEYRGLLSALKKLGYSYNEFIKNIGFKPKYEYKYKNKSYSELKTIFKEQIVPDLNEKLKLKSKSEHFETPSYDEVETYYRGFINTIDRFNKSYIDFVKDLGLNPRQTFEAELGVFNHEALKFVISESMNHDKNRFNYYSEIKILHPKRNLQIDGLIINNTSFSKDIKRKMENFNIRETQASNLIKEIPKKDFILFDFSNGYFCRNNIIRTELIARKIQKYHNLDNSLLFLVGTRWPYQKSIRELPRVINNNNTNISTQNTFLINPSLFSRLVGLEGESLRNFNNIISFNEKRDLEGIKDIIDEYKERKIIILNTDHFKNALKNRSLHRWI